MNVKKTYVKIFYICLLNIRRKGKMRVKRKILLILSAIILVEGCYSHAVRVDGAEKEYKKEYKNIVNESYKENQECTYSLIYINKDEIPELVVCDADHYNISLYTYKNGKVYTLMENWNYGVGGTVIYEYLPKKNVIRIQGSDLAATWTESYFKIKKMELVEKRSLTTYQFKDKNHNGVMDRDEENTYSNKPVEYYKDGKKISKKEYEKLLIKGNYKNVIGQKTYQQILKQLKSNSK